MGRLGNFVEDVNPDVVKVDKEDILSTPFCFQKAYHRDTADGQYWKVYGTFFNEVGDLTQDLFFIVPASESRDLLMEAMNAASPLHFCALEKQEYTPKDQKIKQTFYAFVALDHGTCPCGNIGVFSNGQLMQDFLAEYKGITKEEMELRAEYPKVDKLKVLDIPFCLEKVALKPARDADSRPYWCVYINVGEDTPVETSQDGDISSKVMFFLPSSPSRDRLFKSFEGELPIHCSKMVEKSFTPKGQKELQKFYALEDTKNPVCACGCDLNDGLTQEAMF